MTTREIMQNYLAALQNRANGELTHAEAAQEQKAKSSFTRLFYMGEYKEFAFRTWVCPEEPELTKSIWTKSPQQMTLHEVLAALSGLVVNNNIYDAMRQGEDSGLTAALLERYLELTDEEKE